MLMHDCDFLLDMCEHCTEYAARMRCYECSVAGYLYCFRCFNSVHEQETYVEHTMYVLMRPFSLFSRYSLTMLPFRQV